MRHGEPAAAFPDSLFRCLDQTMTQQESRLPIDAANSDITTAQEFNLSCAMNSQPFRLLLDEWSDGAVEWVLEINPGRPNATIAYGTGQQEELFAVIAANAFLAGVEWGEATARAPMIGQDAGDADDLEAGDGDEAGEYPEAAPRDPNAPYELPPVELLQPAPPTDKATMDESSLAHNARNLETVLKNFGVRGEIMEVRPGPVVTLYELEPAPGLKSSRVINLAEDIARSMRALTVRIAVVPGRSVIGIELPNPTREKVFLREMLDCDAYQQTPAKLALVLGKDIGGTPIVVDLARMPHLLIAGTTGSGKSVCINTMILSLLYRLPPEKCRFIMVDPKMLELSVYDGIPHLLAPW